MPIEFHCPTCGQMLRVPDTAAGKQAKCPGCQQINQVPTDSTSSVSPTPPPAPDAGNPFAGAGAAGSAGSGFEGGSQNPFQTPAEVAQPFVSGSSDANRTGPPWEALGKSQNSFFATTKGVLFSPSETFSTMRRFGGFGDPILFLVIAGGVFGMIGGFMNGVVNGMMNGADAQLLPIQIGAGVVKGVVAGTIGNLIGSFIGAAITHVALMVFKGANQQYEATYRVVAYVTGATAPFQMIPVVGVLVGAIWAIVVEIIGLAKVHDTTTGKAAAAVLVPGLICCGVFLLFGVGLFAVLAKQNGGF